MSEYESAFHAPKPLTPEEHKKYADERMKRITSHRLRYATSPSERMAAHEDHEYITGHKYGAGHDMAHHGEGKPHGHKE